MDYVNEQRICCVIRVRNDDPDVDCTADEYEGSEVYPSQAFWNAHDKLKLVDENKAEEARKLAERTAAKTREFTWQNGADMIRWYENGITLEFTVLRRA